MTRKWGNLESESLSIFLFSLSIPSFPLNFLILSPFSCIPDARMHQVVQPCSETSLSITSCSDLRYKISFVANILEDIPKCPLCYKMQDIPDLCYSVTKLHAKTLNYSSLKQGNVSCSPLCLDFTAIQGGNKLPLIFHKNKCTAVILLAKFYRHICWKQPCLAIRNSDFLYNARALNVKVDQ